MSFSQERRPGMSKRMSSWSFPTVAFSLRSLPHTAALLFSQNEQGLHFLLMSCLSPGSPDAEVESRSYIPGVKKNNKGLLGQHSNWLLGFLQMDYHRVCLSASSVRELITYRNSVFHLGTLLFLESSSIGQKSFFLKPFSFFLSCVSWFHTSIPPFPSLPSFHGAVLWQIGAETSLYPSCQWPPASPSCQGSSAARRLLPSPVWGLLGLPAQTTAQTTAADTHKSKKE